MRMHVRPGKTGRPKQKNACGIVLARLHQRQEHEVHENQVEQHLEAHVNGEEANRVDGHLRKIHGTWEKPRGGGK